MKLRSTFSHRRAFVSAFLLALGASAAHASLVAWYPLDGDANDASGNAFNGVVVGDTVSFGSAGANGATGTAADFSGTGHIDIPWASALNTKDFTVTMWVQPDAAGGGQYRSPITSRDDVAPGGAFRHGFIIYNDNNGNWSFWNGGGTGGNGGWNALGAGAVTVSEWTHLGITYDSASNTKNFYVNGALAGTHQPVAFSPNNGTLPDANPAWTYENEDLHIGGGGDTGTSFIWDGRIDDVTIWNTPLSQAQIQGIMMNSIPEPGSIALLGIALACAGVARRRRLLP